MSLKKLGRYDLVRVLGRGAMGIVYEGRDPNLDRKVAIKTVVVDNLSSEAASDYEVRFRTEARSAARLQHPNIVSVYDSDRDGGIAFLVMEYIQGDDLKHRLDGGERFSLEQSHRMIRDLLSALDYAHQQGIVHRDIKPANLLIEPGGRLKLTDFGVARIQDSGEATRTQGSMIGTLKYMAPEQVQGLKTDARADLFSAGVVLYQLLTDTRPFDSDNDFSIIHQIISHDPPPPSSVNPKLPAAIDAVVARALAKDREQRFATARDFAAALQSAVRRAEDASVVPPPNPSRKLDTTDPVAEPPVSAGAASGGSVSTVTQEMELVYWKDIKDATDPEEFEAFLAKFPEGIYADLARKRLRRLREGSDASADRTVLTGTDASRASPGAAALADDPDGVQPSKVAPGESGQPPEPTPDGSLLPTGALNADAQEGLQPGQPDGLRPVAVSDTSPTSQDEAVPGAAPTPGSRKALPRSRVLAGAGALALAVLTLAGVLMSNRNEPSPQPASEVVQGTPSAAGTLSAGAASDQARPTEGEANADKTVAPVGQAKVAASAPATRRIANDEKARAEEPPVVAVERAKATPTAVAASRNAAKPAATPSSAAVASGGAAAEACRDKFFIAREFCLASACEQPGSRSHPLCVQWREDKRVREENQRLGQQ